jgi:Ca2+-binding EF-hand superfamily protein
MGNASSSSKAPPTLGLVALSWTMPLSKSQVTELMHECIIVTCGCHFQSFTIDRENFHNVLLDIIPQGKDAEIMDLLFTMWDLQGNHFIQFREFLVGISPLACGPRDSLSEILHYSLSLMDTPKSGLITPYNLTKVLRAINATASYLGDNVLKNNEIDEIVRGVFRSSAPKSLRHEDVVYRLRIHPKVHKFIEGRGTNRYRPPEAKDLEQYHLKMIKTAAGSSGRLKASAPILYEC